MDTMQPPPGAMATDLGERAALDETAKLRGDLRLMGEVNRAIDAKHQEALETFRDGVGRQDLESIMREAPELKQMEKYLVPVPSGDIQSFEFTPQCALSTKLAAWAFENEFFSNVKNGVDADFERKCKPIVGCHVDALGNEASIWRCVASFRAIRSGPPVLHRRFGPIRQNGRDDRNPLCQSLSAWRAAR
jgi:hypothetical protein